MSGEVGLHQGPGDAAEEGAGYEAGEGGPEGLGARRPRGWLPGSGWSSGGEESRPRGAGGGGRWDDRCGSGIQGEVRVTGAYALAYLDTFGEALSMGRLGSPFAWGVEEMSFEPGRFVNLRGRQKGPEDRVGHVLE